MKSRGKGRKKDLEHSEEGRRGRKVCRVAALAEMPRGPFSREAGADNFISFKPQPAYWPPPGHSPPGRQALWRGAGLTVLPPPTVHPRSLERDTERREC